MLIVALGGKSITTISGITKSVKKKIFIMQMIWVMPASSYICFSITCHTSLVQYV